MHGSQIGHIYYSSSRVCLPLDDFFTNSCNFLAASLRLVALPVPTLYFPLPVKVRP